MSNSAPRRPLHARSDSETNRKGAVRLVPPEPPQLLGPDPIHEENSNDDIYSRTPLPTHPAHVLSPGLATSKGQYFNGKQGSGSREFQHFPKAHQPSATSSSTFVSSTHNPSQIANSATGSSSSRPRARSKSAKRLVIKVGDGKTFSLVPQDESQPVDDSISLSTKTSSSSIQNIDNSFTSYTNTESTYTAAPSTPPPQQETFISTDHISSASQDSELVGGLRIVPKTPESKGKSIALDYPLPPLPETSGGEVLHSHTLLTKPSFHSTTSTVSETTNYKVYPLIPSPVAESAIASSSSAEPQHEVFEQSSNPSTIQGHHRRDDSTSTTENSNYQSIGQSTPSTVIHRPQPSSESNSDDSIYQSIEQSTPPSVIHRPQFRAVSSTSTSEYSNYQIHEPDTPSSVIHHRPGHRQQASTSTVGDSNYEIHYRPGHRQQASTSTVGDSNYEIHHERSESIAESSHFAPSFSGDSNYRIIQESRAGSPSSVIRRPRAATTSSIENENYVLHEDLSRSVSLVSLSRPVNKYSQESLRIPPLRTKKSRSNDNFGYYKSRSRETLKSRSNHSLRSRANSLASLSTIHTQPDARQGIVTSGSLVHLPATNPKPKPLSSWADFANRTHFHMNETPHQWSSQLSTVLSVSEGGTDRGSRQWSDDTGRRSSVVPSTRSRHSRGSRHILNVGSFGPEDTLTHSRNNSIERPKPAYTRSGRGLSSSSIPVIGDTDEYGDGITAMQDLRTRPSRTRLSGIHSVASSENLRSNTMLSTTSSRANSLLVSTIPTWARLYYGSGERRYLGGPPGSSYGPSEGPSRSNSISMSSGSPDEEHFPNTLYSPRRRPREGYPHVRGQSMQDSIEIIPPPTAQGPAQRTWSMISSVWSPHLRVDRRAARHSLWEPPAVSWSTEGGMFGRRNIQVVLFVTGFLLPFAWMIAAFLPLPRAPSLEMRERQDSAPDFDANANSSSTGLTDYAREFGPLDEARFVSAKWWRMLNRWMSIVGLLIIAAIVILAIEGTRKGW
ncbi:hypothetical protein ACMFMG_008372 [Clarireedia jacksonii]